ncbi:MAG: hypothetical protein ACRDR6_14160 [Pseudonocardiaceae bacterium]
MKGNKDRTSLSPDGLTEQIIAALLSEVDVTLRPGRGIGYDTAPCPGAGLAFFTQFDAGASSRGCMEVPRAFEVVLLCSLTRPQHLRITLGMG